MNCWYFYRGRMISWISWFSLILFWFTLKTYLIGFTLVTCWVSYVDFWSTLKTCLLLFDVMGGIDIAGWSFWVCSIMIWSGNLKSLMMHFIDFNVFSPKLIIVGTWGIAFLMSCNAYSITLPSVSNGKLERLSSQYSIEYIKISLLI